MNKRTLYDIDVQQEKVLVRVDYNVPMQDGVITDDTRIRASLPTIEYLLKENAIIILMSHLGRPKGKVDKQFTLQPVAKHLSELLGKPVEFAEDCIGPVAKEAVGKLRPGQIVLLENLRFYEEEEKNDLGFAEALAELADIYVNDAFGVSHRAHASVDAITLYLPSVAGLLLEKEIKFVGQAIEQPEHPFVAIIGGAKVSDKIGVIDNLLTKVNTLLIGGGMANTFLAAKGYEMGKSLVEEDKIDLAKKLIEKAQLLEVKMLLPTDVVIADRFAADAATENCSVDDIKSEWMALDIGKKTSEMYADAIKDAKMIVWNGPMGVFEMDAFCSGTEQIAQAVANPSAISIIGGGDSVAAIEKLKLADKISHISTGGGASLEYLEGKVLPGIAALDDLRLPMIAGNWKMHKTVSEGLELAHEIVSLTSGAKPEVVIFPPFTAIETIAMSIDGKHVGYGGQDLHWEDQGAYTGAISGTMLADIGCEYVLIGHSERRHVFLESNEIVAKKMQAAIRNNLVPVLCIGETKEEKLAVKAKDVVAIQLKTALTVVEKELIEDIVVAYEPVWAIGTGETATPEDAGKMCKYIREWLLKEYGERTARKVRILYGGSVNDKNAQKFMEIDDIDGLLVGGASLVADKFAQIVRY